MNRRRFLGTAAMTMAAMKCGLMSGEAADQQVPRELTALARATEWINSPRIAAPDLLGKVVLVNFCTYTCINWLRSLPYVRAWSKKYDQSLLVIGVHTPEFPFEHDVENVRRAMRQMKVEYPIVIDNDYAIWGAFRNQYWPALFFVDPRGRVRDRHFGEGEYARSEGTIQRLLRDAGAQGIANGLVSVDAGGVEAAADWGSLKSPELYLAGLGAAPSRLALNRWDAEGWWSKGNKAIALQRPGGKILTRFHARDLHLVMAPPPGKSIRFRVSIDGAAPGVAHGLDVDGGGNGQLVEPRMHQLIRQPGTIVDRTFAIEFLDSGAEAYSFTFG